jgi:hypothetical protein
MEAFPWMSFVSKNNWERQGIQVRLLVQDRELPVANTASEGCAVDSMVLPFRDVLHMHPPEKPRGPATRGPVLRILTRNQPPHQSWT